MKAKKLIAIFMAAIMALSLFAIMTGCDSAEESYVGAWSLSDTEEQYATFDEDGTCVQIIYVEDDTFFEEGGAYIGMEGTYEEINGGISVTYDILGEKKTIEDSKESFFGDDAVYTSIKMSEVPSDYYTFDEYIDLAMDTLLICMLITAWSSAMRIMTPCVRSSLTPFSRASRIFNP